MLTLSGSLRVFLATEPCDMRKSFNGLHAEVTARLGEDPRGGAIFVFTNRRRNLIKLLHFDGTGTWIDAKRLETGTFRWPKSIDPSGAKIRLEPAALAMLTDGIDLRDGARRAWHERSSNIEQNRNEKLVIKAGILDRSIELRGEKGRECSRDAM